MAEEFVGYVGSAEIHDAVILRVERTQETVTVFVTAYGGHPFAIRFYGVSSYKAQNAEGMMLYALSETSEGASHRTFHFLNWEEDDPSDLEIVAERFEMLDTMSEAAKD